MVVQTTESVRTRNFYPVTYTFSAGDVTVIPVVPVTVSAGITEYRWPTVAAAADMVAPQARLGRGDAPDSAALAASWLGEPVSGTLTGQGGLWAHRSGGYIDFFDPVATTITAFHVPQVYSVPAWSYLCPTPAGDAVWGGGWDLTLLYPHDDEAVRFEGGLTWPTAFAYATGTAASTRAGYADGVRGAFVECQYDRGAAALHSRAWLLPPTAEGYNRVPTAVERKATPDGQLWYLDRFEREIGLLTYDEHGGTVQLYALPGNAAPYIQMAGPDAAGLLWFSLNNWEAGYAEIATFDTQTALLTRYRASFSNVHPGTQGGVAGWATAEDVVYQVAWRYLNYLPLYLGN